MILLLLTIVVIYDLREIKYKYVQIVQQCITVLFTIGMFLTSVLYKGEVVY